MLHKTPEMDKNTIKSKHNNNNTAKKIVVKTIKTLLVLLLAVVILVVAIVACALITYHRQPVLTQEDKEELAVDSIWKTRTQPERAHIIEDNGDALLERVKMISNAKSEIVLSTFDFRADESGKIILGALIDAADRGVSVNVIVDGVSGFLRMKGNPYFEALAASSGTSIKIYNKVNPLAPWRSMGRLHDKYLIADKSSYIIGGRNTFSYFLGSNSQYKNYDRDVLVYCENANEDSSVNDLLSYFENVWNYKESKPYMSGVNSLESDSGHFIINADENNDKSNSVTKKKSKLLSKSDVAAAKEELISLYTEYYANNADNVFTVTSSDEELKDADYDNVSGDRTDNTDNNIYKDTYEVRNIALLSNPIEYTSKKPVVWYQLVELMKNAHSKVKIHTPYIICNDYMYDGLEEVCNSVENVSLMTNSIGNNGNPFGSADYYVNKNKILGTGIDVWEYEGGYSYHGKSVLIDDNISVIGSFNLDMRSAYLDTELMLVIDSEDINRQLSESMESYEHVARNANSDGSYDNPYDVEPVELSQYRRRQMMLIKNFVLWARYLF